MEKFIKEAIKLAKKSFDEGEFPVGAILIKNNIIIAKGQSKVKQKQNPILHATIDCIQNSGKLKNYENTTLYITLIPCYLCAGAIIYLGIKKIIIGDSESFIGAKSFLQNYGIEIIDLNLNECKKLIKDFAKKYPYLEKKTKIFKETIEKNNFEILEEQDFEIPFCEQFKKDPSCLKCSFIKKIKKV